ncbi:MAG TPA: 50S ribosomal protein L15 [Egibacteraceae bacterium]|nr:50S ribosomal protein L15 [Egibacteraceae bacterium]
MKIHHLKPASGAHQAKTRKGRGEGGRRGKTAGRGTKGTGARGSGKLHAGFEGGQMPLQRRLPKLPGFTPRNRVEHATVNVARIGAAFDDGDEVTPESLRAKGLIRRGSAPVKILGTGELDKKLSVSAHAFSEAARAKIESGGGSATVLPPRPAAS